MNPGAKEAAQRRAVAKQRLSALEKDTIAHFEAPIANSPIATEEKESETINPKRRRKKKQSYQRI